MWLARFGAWTGQDVPVPRLRPLLRDVGLVLLAIVTVALTVFALRPSDPPGGQDVAVTQSASPAFPSLASSSPASPAVSASPAAVMPRALILGDDLVGDGPMAFPAQLMRARNWDGEVDSGEPFTVAGLADRLSGSYDVVLLCALKAPPFATNADARAAIVASVEAAREAQPDAVLVMVGPLALDGTPKTADANFNASLKQVGVEQKVSVISPIDERWIIMEGVAVDPTRQLVQDVIAARLTEALARRPQVPRGEPGRVSATPAATPTPSRSPTP